EGARIWLPPGHELSDYAVLPPGDGRPPFLAVATHELGQPALYVYDAQSGQRFRRLSGHVERLRSLAFHPNGTMLISTGADQTVCVWSLVDWRECLGQRGWLSGLAVERRGERLLVAGNVDGELTAGGQLSPGDVVVALAEPTGDEKVSRPRDLYASVLRRKPGETITLSITRSGRPRRVGVRLAQATDQRFPLFSLFSMGKTAPERLGQDSLDWVGWSPLGAYDASGPAIEERIGWHFNTGLPDAPVRFALAAEYARLRHVGLLQELLRNPEDAPSPPEDPPPDLSVWVAPNDPNDNPPVPENNIVRVRNGDVTLHVAVKGLSPGMIRSVAWREPGGPLHEMETITSSTREYAANLSAQRWRRADRQIDCLVATNDLERPVLARRIVVAIQPPPPPEIKGVRPAKPSLVYQDKRLSFHAEVTSDRRDDVPIKVTLVHLVEGREQSARPLTDISIVDQPIELQAGENLIRLTAVASDAPPDGARGETTVVERRVYYAPQKPQLALEVVAAHGQRRLLPSGDKNAETCGIDDERITAQGTIVASDELAAAEWRWDEQKWRVFDSFRPGHRELHVEQPLSLEPGSHRLECRATTAGKPASTAEASLTIEYKPRLPRFVAPIRLAPQQITEGTDPLEVVISGEWEPDDRLRPFALTVVRDGQPLEGLVEMDESRRVFRATAPVLPGAANRFQVRIENRWQSELLDAPPVVVLRPPRVGGVEAPTQTRQAHADVRFWVESPNHLEPREVTVGGWPATLDIAAVDGLEPDTARRQCIATNVPLRLGHNRLPILARNDDGSTAEPAVAEIELLAPAAPPPPLAEVVFDSPASSQTFAAPECDVSFTVNSTSPLRRVVLLQNGRHVAEANLAENITKRASGFTLKERFTVRLPASRPQVLSVVAANDGGALRRERTVVYVPPPPRVLVDHIEWQTPTPGRFDAEPQDGGICFGQALPSGDAWIHGLVK
ncbi:MAG TPA: hypothetical protein VGX78_20710, partial [Pirellulales bacterium]|nr:hypothetical protein [Pirellulales bacterium]